MTTHVRHRGDRLVVPFEGELDWPRATAFVDTVDAHLEHYHYRRVELVVACPGGLVAALEHIVRALLRWRGRGVEVRTRVVASAESAAAVLVSLGDERVAAPGARLLYHLSRVCEAGAVTARASAELHGELSRTDAHLVSRLVERALAARGPVPHRAEALRPRRARAGPRHPAGQYRDEVRLPLDRRRHRGAHRRAVPAPPGVQPRDRGPPARNPCAGRVLRLAGRRTLRAPTARACGPRAAADALARDSARTRRTRAWRISRSRVPRSRWRSPW